MKMKYFGNLFLILVVVAFSITAFADEIKTVNFSNALNLVLENNIDLRIAELTLANSQIDWEKNQLASNANTRSQQLNLELDLAKSQDTYANARYNIIYGLVSDFVELTNYRQSVEINQNNLKIKELELERITELYELGSASNSEFLDARLAVADQSLVLQKSEEDFKRLQNDLQEKIGIASEVNFTELELKLNPVTIDSAKILEKALSASFDVKENDILDQLASIDLSKAELDGKPALEMKKLTNKKEITSLNLKKAKDKIESDVEEEIWNLDQALETIEVRKIAFQISQENYNKVKLSYEQGFDTETELLQNLVTYLNAEKAYFTARADYLLKNIQLLHLMGEEDQIGGEI